MESRCMRPYGLYIDRRAHKHIACLHVNTKIHTHIVIYLCAYTRRWTMAAITRTHTHTHKLQWRYNDHDGVSNHQPYYCLLNHHRPLWGNSPVTGEFPAQRASNAENVSIWWRYHDTHDILGLRDDFLSCGYINLQFSKYMANKPNSTQTSGK